MLGTSTPPLHAIVALSLLETMQALDAPFADDPDELKEEMSARRLGTSRSVAEQVNRYRDLARHDSMVAAEEIASLLTLCSRRRDAELLYANAGRLAAAHALARRGASLGLRKALPGGSARSARRVAAAVFGLQVESNGETVTAIPGAARPKEPWAGKPCVFFGSALGVLLRELMGFEGAVLHLRCAAGGSDQCVWSTKHSSGEEMS